MATATFEKAARLTDVAKAAGVSQGTVSNVFNRPELVREEVRERVREVAKKLGYSGPDPKGRLLRGGKVNAIGVATVEPFSFFFKDPFARMLMAGITDAAEANGAGVSLVSAASEDELAWNIRNALVDGFILYCLDRAHDLIVSSQERQLPFVALALGHDDKTISAVGIDNVAGARMVAEHLMALGHRRFGIIGMKFSEENAGPIAPEKALRSTYTASRERVAGYFEALAAQGIDTATVPILETQTGTRTEDPGTVLDALEEIFARPAPPTAILAQSDKIALIALDWLRQRGIRVPQDVSLVGFDGVPESATSIPPLTTVVQPIAEIGRRAVQTILDHDGTIRRHTLDVELVVRGSTAPPRQA
jgi:DNA-binding LacI/PurR family transcriptional regulator